MVAMVREISFRWKSGLWTSQGVDTTKGWRVLIVSADTNRDFVQSALSNWAIEPVCCASLQEAQSFLPDETFSLIFCEDTLSDGTYRDILRPPGKPMKTRLVVISEVSDDQNYNEAKQLGAFDVISSPCRRSDIQWVVIRAIQEEAKHSRAKGRF